MVSDLLRGSTGVEGSNDRVERDPRTCDTEDAVGPSPRVSRPCAFQTPVATMPVFHRNAALREGLPR